MASVLIITELAKGCRWNRNLEPNSCFGRDLNPKPYDWQSSTLTTTLPINLEIRSAPSIDCTSCVCPAPSKLCYLSKMTGGSIASMKLNQRINSIHTWEEL